MKLYFWATLKKNHNNVFPSILALPAYPEGWAGGMERFANWKPYFERDGIRYEIHLPCSSTEFTDVVDRKLAFQKWMFHLRMLKRRFAILKTISAYQTKYIQLEIIPLYDSRHTGMDHLIIDSHKNVVYDFYDADYESTPRVTNFIF